MNIIVLCRDRKTAKVFSGFIRHAGEFHRSSNTITIGPVKISIAAVDDHHQHCGRRIAAIIPILVDVPPQWLAFVRHAPEGNAP